jgi:hypothetical protein
MLPLTIPDPLCAIKKWSFDLSLGLCSPGLSPTGPCFCLRTSLPFCNVSYGKLEDSSHTAALGWALVPGRVLVIGFPTVSSNQWRKGSEWQEGMLFSSCPQFWDFSLKALMLRMGLWNPFPMTPARFWVAQR